MKEKFEPSAEHQNNTESEWDSLAEQSEQEKQSRFSRIGRRIMGVLRSLYRPKDESPAQQNDFDVMNAEDVSSSESAGSETNSEAINLSDEPNEMNNAKPFGDEDMDLDDYYAYKRFSEKKTIRQAERAQELYEREINNLFLPIDELVSILDHGMEQSSKRVEDYNGKEVTIYDTGDLNFYFLNHDLEWTGRSSLFDNPSRWDLSEPDAKAAGLYSNLLSMQLLNSKTMPHRNHVSYGILRLPPNSLNELGFGQGLPLRNRSGIPRLQIDRVPNKKDIPNEVTSSGSEKFVEIQAFRYDEKGEPIFRPDFIIAPSKGLNEDTLNDTLKQAAYFGVPVFCIPKGEKTM